METRNYHFRENDTQRAYFCRLQVSNKFRNSMNAWEAELVEWISAKIAHHTALTIGEQQKVVDAIEQRIHQLNDEHQEEGPWLLMSYAPLRKTDNGFIRIERTSGRHQSLLLPIIDYQGEVNI